MYGYIYKTTDLTNNKIYIGQHKAQKFTTTYRGSGKKFSRILKAHGKENFKIELICWCETSEEADNKEIYYIEAYNARDPNVGYNISAGGKIRTFAGLKHSPEDLKKMSEAKKGRKLSAKHRQNIIEGKNNSESDFFVKVDEETTSKIISNYLNNITINDCAKQFNLSYNRCRKLLLDKNIPLRSKSEALKGHSNRKPYLKLNIEDIIHDYVESKMTLRQCGEKYHVDKATIGTLLKRNNVELRPCNRTSN